MDIFISKLKKFLSIFCWYFRYFVGTKWHVGRLTCTNKTQKKHYGAIPNPLPPPGPQTNEAGGRCRLSVPMVGHRFIVVGRGRCRLSVPTVGRPEAVVDCRYRRLVIGANSCQSRPLSTVGTDGWSSVPTVVSHSLAWGCRARPHPMHAPKLV